MDDAVLGEFFYRLQNGRTSPIPCVVLQPMPVMKASPAGARLRGYFEPERQPYTHSVRNLLPGQKIAGIPACLHRAFAVMRSKVV